MKKENSGTIVGVITIVFLMSIIIYSFLMRTPKIEATFKNVEFERSGISVICNSEDECGFLIYAPKAHLVVEVEDSPGDYLDIYQFVVPIKNSGAKKLMYALRAQDSSPQEKSIRIKKLKLAQYTHGGENYGIDQQYTAVGSVEIEYIFSN
jgi:hypothetical protein